MKNIPGKHITLLVAFLTMGALGATTSETASSVSDETTTEQSVTAQTPSLQNTPSMRPTIAEMPFQTLGIGTQSGCVRPAKMLITNEREWRRIWAVHSSAAITGAAATQVAGNSTFGKTKAAVTAAPELPTVDFSRQAVVVLLLGKSPADSWIEINQVVSTPSATVIFFGSRSGAGPARTQKEQEALATPAATVAALSSRASRSMALNAAKTSAQPFHFAIIDKPVAPVRFNDLLAPECPVCALP